MEIEIKFSTGLKQYLPDSVMAGTIRSLEIAEPATVRVVMEELGIPSDMPKVIMINDRQGAMDDPVNAGDRLMVFPPVGGG